MGTRSRTTKRSRLVAATALVAGLVGVGASASATTGTTTPPDEGTVSEGTVSEGTASQGTASGEGMIIGLITKTDSNPFFVKMREGAQAKADELGVELRALAGAFDGDNEGQVSAIEDLIAAGAAGFMITPSDSVAIVPTIQEARDAGLVVIALDTPLEPIDAADATFATDNFRAGELIGEWAAATIENPDEARIALLNHSENQPSVDVLRNQGFLTGFGIDVGDDSEWGDEDDPRIVGQEVSGGGTEEGGRTGMENLLAIDPDINLVYTINEPTAAGARLALDAAGSDALVVSIDGGCPGVENVRDGLIGATSMQFPLLMAQMGVEAIATGEIPPNTEGIDFVDTGVELITDNPVEGIDSQDTEWGLENCWG